MNIPPRSLAPWALAIVFALTACRKDEGPEKLSAARAQYEQLVLAGKGARDPAFDRVLKQLEAIPADSRARPEADRLREAIVKSRGRLPERPLATASELRTDDPEVKQKQEECSRLAQQLGKASGADREVRRVELAHCRTELEKLLATDRHGHPEAQTPDAGAP